MKRAIFLFLLSAAGAYLAAGHFLRTPPTRRPRFNATPDLGFAVGGLIPLAQMPGGDDALLRLHAAHCAGADRPADVGPDEIAGVVPWKWGSPATVVCPDSEVARRETLVGYDARCDAERVELYARLGRVTRADMVGCLLILGARDATVAEADTAALPEGFRAAFSLRNRTYLWTEKSDSMDGVIDEVVPAPEPEAADAPRP